MNNDIVDILVIGFDCFKGYFNGFVLVCFVVWVIVCKKYVEDDINCKLMLLGINGKVCDNFMRDIFGREFFKEKGLIDLFFEEEFDFKLLKLRLEWEKCEMEVCSIFKLEFVYYFDVYVCMLVGRFWR